MTIRQATAGGPLDLIAVYENLVTMIRARCRGLDAGSNPVVFMFIDTGAPQEATSMRSVPTEISRALWRQGPQALRDIADAVLDPSRQIDTAPELGLEQGFCPDLAVLVFQFWADHEVREGRLQEKRSYQRCAGVPHRLQVELRSHGCVPVSAEWKVLQRDGRPCVVPMLLRRRTGPVDLPPLRLPTDSDVASLARLAAESRRVLIAEIQAKLASMQLPTFVVRSPPLQEFHDGSASVHVRDSRYVTFRAGGEGAALDGWPDDLGIVTLQVEGGLVVPTFYGTYSESDESFSSSGATMVVYRSDGKPGFRIEVIQPQETRSSGQA